MRVSQDDAIRRLLLALNIEPANNAQSETGYGRDCAPLPLFSARDVMQANCALCSNWPSKCVVKCRHHVRCCLHALSGAEQAVRTGSEFDRAE